MARVCTVCASPDRAAIDRALVAGEVVRTLAGRFGLSKSAMLRHKETHLTATLAEAERRQAAARGDGLLAQATTQENQANQYGIDLRHELGRCFERANLLLDACDRWLRDPDDPSRYNVDPRADDVTVTFWEDDPNGRPTRQKAKLSALLARVKEAGVDVHRWETRHADPRELILKTMAQLKSQLELVAKLIGELDDRPTINLALAPEWLAIRAAVLAALAAYPEARIAVADRLGDLEAGRARH